LIATCPPGTRSLPRRSGSPPRGPRCPGISAKRSDKPSWPTSQSASRCSPTTLSPTTKRKLAKHLYAEERALFTFLTHDGVDATNWRAEQAIRPAVVNRKVWGGNRTWRGAATQARMMSLIRTARPQTPRRDRVPHTPRRAPTRRTYRRFSRRTYSSSARHYIEMAEWDPLSKYRTLLVDLGTDTVNVPNDWTVKIPATEDGDGIAKFANALLSPAARMAVHHVRIGAERSASDHEPSLPGTRRAEGPRMESRLQSDRPKVEQRHLMRRRHGGRRRENARKTTGCSRLESSRCLSNLAASPSSMFRSIEAEDG